MAWLRMLNPEVFQGNLERKQYFEGWYLKHVSADLEHVWAFIPGVSLADNTAFIQAIDGITGETTEFLYPLEEFRWNDQSFSISIADNVFCNTYSRINLKNEKMSISGELKYSNMVKYPRSLTSPGIMGWYSFVPLMECYHAVVSVNHDLQGSIKVNKTTVDFKGGKGYIEKDWGKSFPEAWIWTHCNHFADQDTSLMLSIARVPWLGQSFNGIVGYLYRDETFHTFATWNGTKIIRADLKKDTLSLELKNEEYTLRVKAVRKKTGELRAPQAGSMSRIIKESVDSTISYELEDRDGKVVKDKGQRAGLEVIEDIFQYLEEPLKDKENAQTDTD